MVIHPTHNITIPPFFLFHISITNHSSESDRSKTFVFFNFRLVPL